MGLFMDADGIPLSFSTFEGNQNEQPSMTPLEKKIIKDFDTLNSLYVLMLAYLLLQTESLTVLVDVVLLLLSRSKIKRIFTRFLP